MTGPLKKALASVRLLSVEQLIDTLAKTLQTPHTTRADLARAVDAGLRAAYREMAMGLLHDAARYEGEAHRALREKSQGNLNSLVVDMYTGLSDACMMTGEMILQRVDHLWQTTRDDTESDEDG